MVIVTMPDGARVDTSFIRGETGSGDTTVNVAPVRGGVDVVVTTRSPSGGSSSSRYVRPKKDIIVQPSGETSQITKLTSGVPELTGAPVRAAPKRTLKSTARSLTFREKYIQAYLKKQGKQVTFTDGKVSILDPRTGRKTLVKRDFITEVPKSALIHEGFEQSIETYRVKERKRKAKAKLPLIPIKLVPYSSEIDHLTGGLVIKGVISRKKDVPAPSDGFEKRLKALKEREKRLEEIKKVAFIKLHVVGKPDYKLKFWDKQSLKEIGKATVRLPIHFAGMPSLIGGRIALASEALVRSPKSRAELVKALPEVPAALAKTFDPRYAEGLVSLAFISAPLIAKGARGTPLKYESIKIPLRKPLKVTPHKVLKTKVKIKTVKASKLEAKRTIKDLKEHIKRQEHVLKTKPSSKSKIKLVKEYKVKKGMSKIDLEHIKILNKGVKEMNAARLKVIKGKGIAFKSLKRRLNINLDRAKLNIKQIDAFLQQKHLQYLDKRLKVIKKEPPKKVVTVRALGLEKDGHGKVLVAKTPEGLKFLDSPIKHPIPLKELKGYVAPPKTAIGAKVLSRVLKTTGKEKVRIMQVQQIMRKFGTEKGLPVADLLLQIKQLKHKAKASKIIEKSVAKGKGEIYGTATMQQLPKKFQVKIGDVDLLFKKLTEKQVSKKLQVLTRQLKKSGEDVTWCKAKPLEISFRDGTKLIEAKGGRGKITAEVIPHKALGFSLEGIPRKMGKAKSTRIGTQVKAKGASVTYFRRGLKPGEKIDIPAEFKGPGVFPKLKRMKDLPHFTITTKGISYIKLRPPKGPSKSIAELVTGVKGAHALKLFKETFTKSQQLRLALLEKELLLKGEKAVIKGALEKPPDLSKPIIMKEVYTPPRKPSPRILSYVPIFIPLDSVPTEPSPKPSPRISYIPSPSPKPSPKISPTPSPSPLTYIPSTYAAPSPSPYVPPSPPPYVPPSPPPYIPPSVITPPPPSPPPKPVPFLKYQEIFKKIRTRPTPKPTLQYIKFTPTIRRPITPTPRRKRLKFWTGIELRGY